MLRIYIILTILLLQTDALLLSQENRTEPVRIIVRFSDTVSQEKILSILNRYELSILKSSPSMPLYVCISGKAELFSKEDLKRLNKEPDVSYAEYDQEVSIYTQ